MRIDELVSGLDTVGLDEDEAEVYVRLLQTGPSKVGTLAEVVDVSRSTLYRLLDDLADRGVVTKSLERPTIYEAEPAEVLFESALASIDRRRAEVERVQASLLESLEAVSGRPPDRDVRHWHLLEGAAKIRDSLHRLFEDAEEEIWMASNEGTAGATPFSDACRHLVEGGGDGYVPVRVLARRDRLASTGADREGVEVRHLASGGSFHFCLVDGGTLVAWVHTQPSGRVDEGDVAIWTDAPGLVEGHRMLFERLWDESEDAA